MRVLRIGSASATLTAGLLLAASSSLAATKDQCVDADTQAQTARRAGKFAESRARLQVCIDASCPGVVRDDCVQRLDELNRTQPTVVFDVKDGSGNDVIAVKVSVDGSVLTEKLDGTAIAVDPGAHEFVFEVAGQAPLKKTLLVKEGEKSRRERVVVGPALQTAPAPAAPSAPPVAPASSATTPPMPPQTSSSPPSPETSNRIAEAPTPPTQTSPSVDSGPSRPHGSPMKTLGFVSVGVGIGSLFVGGAFGVLAGSAWSDAKSECNVTVVPSTLASCPNHDKAVTDHDKAVSEGTLSTIGLVAGGALFATGVVLVLAARSPSDGQTTGLVVAPALGSGSAGVAVRGGF